MKDITLKITSKQISEETGEDLIQFVTDGKLYEKENSIFVIYEESELTGVPGCKSTLKIKGDTVRMKRIGQAALQDTAMEFEVGRRYSNFYNTPYGTFEMELLTNSIENSLNEDGLGKINIDYHISLNGVVENRNKMCIEIF